MKIDRKKIKEHLGVLGFFTVSALFLFYPVVFHLNSRLVGTLGLEDSHGSIWMFWFWKNYLGQQWAYLTFEGVTLSAVIDFIKEVFLFPTKAYWGNFTDFVPRYFLNLFLSQIATHNVWFIITFILNGLSFYYLAFYLFKNRIISFVTALMFAASPYYLLCTYFGWLEQIYMFPLPLYFLFLIKFFEEKENGVRNAVLAGACLALASVFYWFYGIFTIFFSFVYGFWYLLKPGKDKNVKRTIGRILIAVLVYVVLVSPFVIPYARMSARGDTPDDRFFTGRDFPHARDARGHDNNILIDSCSWDYIIRPVERKYIPPVITFLVLISLLFIRRIPFVWYIGTGFFYLTSLGPYLKKGGYFVSGYWKMWIYHVMYKYFPFFPRFHWPSRVSALTLIFSLIIVGYTLVNLVRLTERVKKHSVSKALSVILPLTIFVIYVGLIVNAGFLPLKVTPAAPPSFYQEIGKEESEIGIIELPFDHISILRGEEDIITPAESSSRYTTAYYQIFHEKKVIPDSISIGGYPKENDIMLFTYQGSGFTPYLKYLAYIDNEEMKSEILIEPEDRDYLKQLGYKYVVLHKAYFMNVSKVRKKTFDPITMEQRNKLIDQLFSAYMKEMKKEFGPPVSKGYEFIWNGKENVFSSHTPIKELAPRRWPVIFFKL